MSRNPPRRGRGRAMQSPIVLTLTGPDRIGIVEEVTRLLLERGGNVEMSRMARLGGEFAILLLASLPAEGAAGLEEGLGGLTARGYKVTISRPERARAEIPAGWLPYEIEVQGAD